MLANMLVRSLTLLVVLTTAAASIDYETTLSEGELPRIEPLRSLPPQPIPNGQCTKTVSLSRVCSKWFWLRAPIRKLVGRVVDHQPYPVLEFSSKYNRNPDTVTVHRQQPCKGEAIFSIQYECELKNPWINRLSEVVRNPIPMGQNTDYVNTVNDATIDNMTDDDDISAVWKSLP